MQLQFIRNQCNWQLEDAVYKVVSKEVNNRQIIPAIDVQGTREEVYQHRIQTFQFNEIEYDHYEDSILYFSVNEEWEWRTTITDDKKYVGRKVKKKDVIWQKLVYQSHNYRTNNINFDAIVTKYRESLKEKNIELDTPIYLSVESDIYDTIRHTNFGNEASIRYNHVTPVFYTGLLDEVMYTAYLDIPFATVYRSMDKSWLRIFYGISIVLVVGLVCFYIERLLEQRKNEIKCIGEDCYKFGNLVFFNDKKILLSRGREYKMFPRTSDLLLMLLKDKEHTVSTSILLDILTSKDNLHRNITNLRNVLKSSGSIYKLSYLKENDCYRLEVMQEDKYRFLSPPFFKNCQSIKVAEKFVYYKRQRFCQ